MLLTSLGEMLAKTGAEIIVEAINPSKIVNFIVYQLGINFTQVFLL